MFCVNLSFLLVLVWVAATSGLTMQDFFPNINQNLTKITWAHAVNNQSLLNETLKNDGINMIEADIVLGTLYNQNKTIIPIMAHPPNNQSDLSLETFLQQIQDFNNVASNMTRKGVKLDFKKIDAFNASKTIVAKFDNGTFPMLINADILSGPIDADTLPVDAKAFLSGAKTFLNSTLSIGWTTSYGSNSSGSYDSDQIALMISTIRENNVTQNITFPVRAGLAAESRNVFVNLTSEIENSTLTLWSAEGDKVNVDNLRLLIKTVGINKTYIDVPDDLLVQLHLDSLPSSSPPVPKLLLAVYFISFFIGFRNVLGGFIDLI